MPKPTRKAASGDGAGTNNKVIALCVLTNPGLIVTLFIIQSLSESSLILFLYHNAKSQQNSASYIYITITEENTVFSGKKVSKWKQAPMSIHMLRTLATKYRLKISTVWGNGLNIKLKKKNRNEVVELELTKILFQNYTLKYASENWQTLSSGPWIISRLQLDAAFSSIHTGGKFGFEIKVFQAWDTGGQSETSSLTLTPSTPLFPQGTLRSVQPVPWFLLYSKFQALIRS